MPNMFLRSLIWWLKQRVCTHIIALCLWNAFCYWVRGSVLYFHLVGLGLGSHSYCIVNRELIESWPIRDTLVRCCRAASWYLKTSHNVVIYHEGSLLDAVGVNVRPYKMVVQGKRSVGSSAYWEWKCLFSDWLHNSALAWLAFLNCELYRMSGNLMRPKFTPTICNPDGETLSLLRSDDNQWEPIISCPADFPVELVLFLCHIILGNLLIVESYSSKTRFLSWFIIQNTILPWYSVPISWETQQKIFLWRHLRYLDSWSWGTFIVNSFPAGPAAMKAWSNTVHSILQEHPKLNLLQ